MKKGILSGITSLLSIGLVSAQTNAEEWGRTASGSIVKVLDNLKLNPTALSTVLLALLLWMVIYSIIRKMDLFTSSNGKLGSIVTTAMALIITWLAFIFMPENFVEAIVLQYGAMGAAILAFIPFAIILYFSLMVVKSLLAARVIWIFYCFYYLALFLYRFGTSTVTEGFWSALPYLVAFLAGVMIFFGIPTFRDLIIKGTLQAKGETEKQKQKNRQLSRGLTEAEYDPEDKTNAS